VKRLLLLAACATVALPAAAQVGPYLGGSLGQSTFTKWCDVPGSCDDTDTAWKLFGGYRINRHFGIEATYVEWGEVTASAGALEVAASQHSYGLAAVGMLPVGQAGLELFGKLGFLLTSQETRSTFTVERDETELHYGLGVKYVFSQNLAARAEWEETEKLKVRMLSIGLEYRF
jgi:OmpA-OmpF porin, OOP family